MHSTTTSADVRVALWGWSGQMQEGGETIMQRLDKGLEVGDVVEVKKILKEDEWALASRPGQDKVTLFSELKRITEEAMKVFVLCHFCGLAFRICCAHEEAESEKECSGVELLSSQCI